MKKRACMRHGFWAIQCNWTTSGTEECHLLCELTQLRAEGQQTKCACAGRAGAQMLRHLHLTDGHRSTRIAIGSLCEWLEHASARCQVLGRNGLKIDGSTICLRSGSPCYPHAAAWLCSWREVRGGQRDSLRLAMLLRVADRALVLI